MSFFLAKYIEYETGNNLSSLDECLDIASNEIFFDDVFLYRLYDWKIKSFSSHETDRNLLSMILYEVIYRIMEKGGKPKDETGNFQYEIDKYGDNFLNRELAMKIANFQIENPDYGGSDWGGIWFYPTEKTLKLMKELNIGE